MKTDIFICEQNCDECAAKNECPMKNECSFPPGEEDDALISQIAETFMREKLEQMRDNIDPKWLISRFDIGFFNLIQGIDLLLKNGESLSQKDVGKKIESIMRENDTPFFQLLDDSFYRIIAEKMRSTVRTMAKTILDAVERRCPAEKCQTCWLEGKCPQKGQLELHSQ
ncbi:MAG: hypothetical protein U9M90_00975 [Patescibacteria group bacterium]|nr:hypothetical protein [Patescibacteria group bacterium]